MIPNPGFHDAGGQSPEHQRQFRFEKASINALFQFANTLPVHCRPTSSTTTLHFDPAMLTRGNVMASIIEDATLTRDLKSAEVTMTDMAATPDHPEYDSTSITLTTSDTQTPGDRVITISRASDHRGVGDTPHDYEIKPSGAIGTIERVSDADIAIILLQLSGMGDEASMVHQQPHTIGVPPSGESYYESLRRFSVSDRVQRDYELPSGRQAHCLWLSDSLVNMTLNYENGPNGERMIVELNNEDGLRLKFRSLDPVEGSRDIKPLERDHIKLYDVISEETHPMRAKNRHRLAMDPSLFDLFDQPAAAEDTPGADAP